MTGYKEHIESITGKKPFLQQIGPVIDKQQIQMTRDILGSWQGIVNTLADICDVPAALIRKLAGDHMEVICSSESKNNPFQKGDRTPLKDLYSNHVIRTKERLLIPNVKKIDEKSPHRNLGPDMVSYLGFPLLWPDGDIYGTISLLDSKEHSYTPRFENFLLKFKELAETQLAMLFKNIADRRSLEYILNNFKEGVIAHDLNRRILFFSDGAERITGYRREEILGKDCHQAFGAPFCGNRCSFCSADYDISGKKEYTVNIITKNGETRMIEMSVIMMKDENNQDIGVLSSFNDLTELIKLQMDSGKLFSFSNIIGRDSKMISVFKQIRDVTSYDFPVHISGETGTGKELVAHAIHNESSRGSAPFVPINCGALPEGLIESELFGHVKGAFSGAIRDKKGRFELADGGTVFLDEISELPKLMQVKLLRFLQESTFEKVGGEKTVSVDVRVISATNKEIKEEVQKGNFREDLYYRLNVIPISVPPLRERKNDIPLLVDHFLNQFPGHHNHGIVQISDEALSVMMDYRWPGNVRELQNTVQFAIVRCRGNTIRPEDLPLELRDFIVKKPRRGPAIKLDAEAVKKALLKAGENKVRAARLLGVGRATLYRFLDKYPDIQNKS
jgi:PAS domain S-box-containing protein